jgi:DNA-directed RNA polymerase subunit RPC12/RpoP
MNRRGEIDGLRRVKSHHKRRCPHCHSSKWDWLGAVSITIEELPRYLLVRYRCKKCGNQFLVEEAKKARYVTSADRCAHCNSPDVEQTSGPDADVGVFRCRKCNAYMVIGGPVAKDGPMIIDLPDNKGEGR